MFSIFAERGKPARLYAIKMRPRAVHFDITHTARRQTAMAFASDRRRVRRGARLGPVPHPEERALGDGGHFRVDFCVLFIALGFSFAQAHVRVLRVVANLVSSFSSFSFCLHVVFLSGRWCHLGERESVGFTVVLRDIIWKKDTQEFVISHATNAHFAVPPRRTRDDERDSNRDHSQSSTTEINRNDDSWEKQRR